MNSVTKHSIDELCGLTGASKRTIRFYIQQRLVDRPLGEKRGSYYSENHLEQILTIQKWKQAGLSLERIRELLNDEGDSGELPPPRPRQPGEIEVASHLHISDGLELQIQPERSGLTPEEVRLFSKRVIETFEQIKADKISKERS